MKGVTPSEVLASLPVAPDAFATELVQVPNATPPPPTS